MKSLWQYERHLSKLAGKFDLLPTQYTGLKNGDLKIHPARSLARDADVAIYVGPEASEEDVLSFLEDIAARIKEEGIWRTSPKYPEECPV